MLAVEVYNKPGRKFKSAAYICLMIIAWTSLLHAIFLKQRKKPHKKNKNGRYEKVDGDYIHWELGKCVREYWKKDESNPIRKNLEFFIPLRNKIEHRQIPELDSSIFGECQSLLLNFDSLLEKHFDAKHRLREFLSFSLQICPTGSSFAEAAKVNKDAEAIKKFIEEYRTTLGPGVYSSDQYTFKAVLIQVKNHQSADALAIQFVHWNSLSTEKQEQMKHFVVAEKLKNPSLLKPSQVVSLVQKEINKKFTMNSHTRCWKKYEVRPLTDSKEPGKTNTKYCHYNELNNNYGYTNDWVAFLVEKLKDDSEYNALNNLR